MANCGNLGSVLCLSSWKCVSENKHCLFLQQLWLSASQTHSGKSQGLNRLTLFTHTNQKKRCTSSVDNHGQTLQAVQRIHCLWTWCLCDEPHPCLPTCPNSICSCSRRICHWLESLCARETNACQNQFDRKKILKFVMQVTKLQILTLLLLLLFVLLKHFLEQNHHESSWNGSNGLQNMTHCLIQSVLQLPSCICMSSLS